jgi:hypothetical protein
MVRWRCKRGSELDRLLDLKPTDVEGSHLRATIAVTARDKLLVFLTRRDVEATNNESERAQRPSVIFRRVTNGFRSEWGLRRPLLHCRDRPPRRPERTRRHPRRSASSPIMSSQAAISAIIVIHTREAGPINGRAIGKIRMDDLKKTIRRNKLLGMWAAEKMGITGRDAEAYSDALAVGTLDPERSDVFSKIRKDFDAAGVVQSDEQIVRVMNELMLKAGNQVPVTPGGALDAAAVMLARKLKSR